MNHTHASDPSISNAGAAPRRVSFTQLDLRAFAADLEALRAEEEARLSLADFYHLRRRARAGRALSALGFATAWIAPNPLSALCLSLGAVTRHTIVAHHVMHRGLDRIDGVPKRYTSRHFAKGLRRAIDWLDWIEPEAWDLEHNVLHHYATGELADPDLVEENLSGLEHTPRAVRALIAAFYGLSWKLTYYAPSTHQILERSRARKARGEPSDHRADARGNESYLSAFSLRSARGRTFWRRCVLPYFGGRFVAPTAAAALLGPWAAGSMLSNLVFAELLSNLHTFAVIATNHAGDDVYRFEQRHRGRAEFFLRQVLGSVNFEHGGALYDFLCGYLNYQIEHHLFPDLPPSSLERLAPKVRAVCEKHGVPYLQQPLHARVRKLLQIFVGSARMPIGETEPALRPQASAAA